MKYKIEKGISPPMKGFYWEQEFKELSKVISLMNIGDSIVISAQVYSKIFPVVRRLYPDWKFSIKGLEIANENGVNRRVWRVL
jgi:hypothetical protein